jgi:hypothetical protein
MSITHSSNVITIRNVALFLSLFFLATTGNAFTEDHDTGYKVEVKPGENLMITGIAFEGDRDQVVLLKDLRTGTTLFAAYKYTGQHPFPWIIVNHGQDVDFYVIVCLAKVFGPIGSEAWMNIPPELQTTSRSDENGPFLLTA